MHFALQRALQRPYPLQRALLGAPTFREQAGKRPRTHCMEHSGGWRLLCRAEQSPEITLKNSTFKRTQESSLKNTLESTHKTLEEPSEITQRTCWSRHMSQDMLLLFFCKPVTIATSYSQKIFVNSNNLSHTGQNSFGSLLSISDYTCLLGVSICSYRV